MHIDSEEDYLERLWETYGKCQETEAIRRIVRSVCPKMQTTDVYRVVDSDVQKIDVCVPPEMAFPVEEAIQQAIEGDVAINSPILITEMVPSE